MATGILESLEESISPLPRAPPPSPECPTHKDDITQFDFNALFLKSSPISSREPSEPASPSWNESGNFNQSPFFYPSPDRPQATPTCTTTEEHPIAISVPVTQQFNQELSYSCNESAYTTTRHPPLFSSSLPVNGDMDQLQAYYTQHNQFPNMERIAESSGETSETRVITHRRRKLSLKRQHSDVTNDTRTLETISKKKLCSDTELDHNSYDMQALSNSVTSKLSLQGTHHHQPFTVGSYPVQSTSTYLSNDSSSSHLPKHADSYPMASNGYFMAEGGRPRAAEYVQPQGYVQQTIGFNMMDDQMDCTEQTNIPISITRVDSIDAAPMDTTGSTSINHTVMNNSFSFNLVSTAPSSSFLSPSRPRTTSHGNYSSYGNHLRLNEVKQGLTFIHEPISDGTHPFQHDISCQFSKSL